MKKNVLLVVLGISLLLNGVGVVFFIGFLQAKDQYQDMKKQRNELYKSITVMRAAGVLSPEGESVIRKVYRSHVDGIEDAYGMMAPLAPPPQKGLTLVVYMHGMGSNFLEPFVNPADQPIAKAIVTKDPSTVFMSVNYRGKASWGNEASISDISQNIREVMAEYPIDKVILVGTSMGGCTVLNYATKAPQDIKDKLQGIVSVESAGDLALLYKQTNHPAVQGAMIEALGGTPEQKPEAYADTSFLHNIGALPKNVNVAVISAKQDHIVPPRLQRDIVDALIKQGVRVKLIEVDEGHGAPEPSVYLAGMDFAKSGS
ncbi:MAG: alpha/beta fold hydrolase [Candidatus Obscuribacterales bacterium]|nr:alpha/beta fold hydrolase [Candidatus Obscuribacterales bacterium]